MKTSECGAGPAAEYLNAQIPQECNELTKRVIGLAMEVHTQLGPGLLERLYEEAFNFELRNAGLEVKRQYPIRVQYKSIELGEQRLDLVVNDLVVVEIKASSEVADAHLAQLTSYLKASRLPLGLLINFHALRLKDGVYRRVNPTALPKHTRHEHQ